MELSFFCCCFCFLFVCLFVFYQGLLFFWISAVHSPAWLLSPCSRTISVLCAPLSHLGLKVQLLSRVSPLSCQELRDCPTALFSAGFLFCLSASLRGLSGEGRLCMELKFLPGAWSLQYATPPNFSSLAMLLATEVCSALGPWGSRLSPSISSPSQLPRT